MKQTALPFSKRYRSPLRLCTFFPVLLLGIPVLCLLYARFLRARTAAAIVTEHRSRTILSEESSNVAIVLLSKPLHKFHSDHWFHIAEYYISNNDRAMRSSSLSNSSNRVAAEQLLGLKSSGEEYSFGKNSTAVERSLITESSVASTGASVVLIVAPDDSRFLKRLTKMAFFLLLLSFTDEDVRSVFIVRYTQPFSYHIAGVPSSFNLESFLAAIPADSTAQYDATLPIHERFLMRVKQRTQHLRSPSTLEKGSGGLEPTTSAISSLQADYQKAADNVADPHSNSSIFVAGGAPTNSGHWFTSTGQVNRMRRKIASLCSCHNPKKSPATAGAARNTECNSSSQCRLLRVVQPDILVSRKLNGTLLPRPQAIMRPLSSLYIGQDENEGSNENKGNKRRQHYRIVVYERNANRYFSDLEGILTYLSKHTDTRTPGPNSVDITWDIDVIYHSDDMNPCLLYLGLGDADIFLTTHGFQSTALLFMKPGAVLIEVFPYKYFKESYVRLSASYGIHHRWVQNIAPTSLSRQALRFVPQKVCMSHRRCRSHARGDSVQVTAEDLSFILDVTREVQKGIAVPPLKLN